jgi:hypothetical protein
MDRHPKPQNHKWFLASDENGRKCSGFTSTPACPLTTSRLYHAKIAPCGNMPPGVVGRSPCKSERLARERRNESLARNCRKRHVAALPKTHSTSTIAILNENVQPRIVTIEPNALVTLVDGIRRSKRIRQSSLRGQDSINIRGLTFVVVDNESWGNLKRHPSLAKLSVAT